MHKRFLIAALEKAWLGRGICTPNPSVGAVAVHMGEIIAQSWHQGAGTPHAEQLLLEQVPKYTPNVTLYVTLEPCNHWGRTPPCVDAIIQHGIKTVVYGYRDPNPVIQANDTPSLLRKQGIEVIHYPIAEIDAFYQSYHHWTLTQKPWVTAKIAQTMDGKIAAEGGKRVCLSNSSCNNFTHTQRLHSDVILTTAQTINQDNPKLNARLNDAITSKPVAILDRTGSINPEATVFKTAKHCHIYHAGTTPSYPTDACTYHTIPEEEGLLRLENVIQHLGTLGYHDVWVEAGGKLFTALHQAGLANKTYVYIVPTLLGDNAVSAYHAPHLFSQPHAIQWQPMQDNMLAIFDWKTD